MSILNAWIDADRALVCVDTFGRCAGGKGGHISKLIPIPHLNAVIAFRGVSVFGLTVAGQALAAGLAFDEILRRLPDVFAPALNVVHQLAAQEGVDSAELDRQEIAFIGWSPGQQRMVGHLWQHSTPDKGFELTEIAPYFLGVWDESFEAHGEPSSPRPMMALARAQIAFLQRTEPSCPCGGGLVLAELGPASVTVSAIYAGA